MASRLSQSYLIVAEELPKGKERCRESNPGSMSVVFMRQVYKALRRGMNEDTGFYVLMRDLAFHKGRPFIECSDLKPNIDAAIAKASRKRFRRVLLLGKEVQNAFISSGRMPDNAILMGFPTGTNEDANVTALRAVFKEDRVLKRQLEDVIQTVEGISRMR